MYSSSSSGLKASYNRRGQERGIPRKCRCGAVSVIKTSETLKNPGRLFYCCPYGSKENCGHLFKWTDLSMVEEIEEVESVVEKIQVDVGSLEKGLHDVEAEMKSLAMNSNGSEIEGIKAVAQGCEKEIGELKAMIVCCEKEIQALRSFKNLIVCSVVMFVVYALIF
ncbi:PREDICTED: uncharacterized protein At4g04775-like [Camelina sativa]|uniref:Uncharacterized protein At4g04775-like n=1 Tax=Camelina sativa TaxID=90675 RepID=A0ABM0XFD0_CAMSA|nr:PREDICTED: uncharacterized protein At4g04775-like [Camelina sativa]